MNGTRELAGLAEPGQYDAPPVPRERAAGGTRGDHARALFPAGGARHDRAHRNGGRAHDVPHHGLHHVRQPDDPGRRRHGQGRGLRRHLRRVGLGHADHGALCQLPAGVGAGHGAQRLFHLRRRQGHALFLAGGARRRVPVWRAVPGAEPEPHPRMDRRRHPAIAEDGDLCRDRPVPRHHRPQERRHRRRLAGNAGEFGRPQIAGDGAGGRRVPRHGRARCPPRARRDRHRRADRNRRRRAGGRLALCRNLLAAAEPRPHFAQ